MAISQIVTNSIADGAVAAVDIATGAVTQTKIATGVAGTGPAFSAYNSVAQTITTSTFTKVTLGTETFDTNSNFASSTFTPTVAGYYQINGNINTQASTSITRGIVLLYKNGAEYIRGSDTSGIPFGLSVSAIIYCNGTTDYIELFGFITATTAIISFNNGTTMSGCLVRSA